MPTRHSPEVDGGPFPPKHGRPPTKEEENEAKVQEKRDQRRYSQYAIRTFWPSLDLFPPHVGISGQLIRDQEKVLKEAQERERASARWRRQPWQRDIC